MITPNKIQIEKLINLNTDKLKSEIHCQELYYRSITIKDTSRSYKQQHADELNKLKAELVKNRRFKGQGCCD